MYSTIILAKDLEIGDMLKTNQSYISLKTHKKALILDFINHGSKSHRKDY